MRSLSHFCRSLMGDVMYYEVTKTGFKKWNIFTQYTSKIILRLLIRPLSSDVLERSDLPLTLDGRQDIGLTAGTVVIHALSCIAKL